VREWTLRPTLCAGRGEAVGEAVGEGSTEERTALALSKSCGCGRSRRTIELWTLHSLSSLT